MSAPPELTGRSAPTRRSAYGAIPPAIVTRVFEDVERIRLPLPGPGVDHVNVYLVRGAAPYGKDLLIDCGLDIDVVRRALEAALMSLGGDLGAILVTHAHPDHLGSADALAGRFGVPVMLHRADSIAGPAWTPASRTEWAVGLGLPPDVLVDFLRPGWAPNVPASTVPVAHGDTIGDPGSTLTVAWTPGHTTGHVCAFDAKRRVLFSGDHLLSTATHVGIWGPDAGDPLRDYLGSLEVTRRLAPLALLPGHGPVVEDATGRIAEIRDRHEARGMQIVTELWTSAPLTPFEVASRLPWTAERLPLTALGRRDVVLAVSQVLAHLGSLERLGMVAATTEAAGRPYVGTVDPHDLEAVYPVDIDRP